MSLFRPEMITFVPCTEVEPPRVRRLRPLFLVLLIAFWLCLVTSAARAEDGILVVHVKDVQKRPIAGLQIGIEGDGGSSITGDDGKARIRLANQTKVKSWVFLQILSSPPGKDFVMVSPWDYRAIVPSFANESENFVEVVVVARGDRAALESGVVLLAAAAQLNRPSPPKTADEQTPPSDPKANLAEVAKQYGLAPDDLDRAIRAWGAKTTDPYEVGLAALYERNYSKASTQLAASLKEREEKLAADRAAVADAAFFLGRSLWEEGKYRDSAAEFRRCLELQPDNSAALNSLAVSLSDAGEYSAAEPLYRQALAIDEKALGPDHPLVATVLSNLGELLQAKGDYAGAEPLFLQALAIDEKALGPDHPAVAFVLSNLGELLHAKGDYAGAEPLFRRALAIDEKALGPDHPAVAMALDNLGGLLEARGDYAEAEPLYRQALAIDEKALGPDHPAVALLLNNRARLRKINGDYAEAEPLYRQALAIAEKALGPDHPLVAVVLNNLGDLLEARGDYADVEALFQRALAIDEKALGPDHPTVARRLNNLAGLLGTKGDYAGAEPLYQRALGIDERKLGFNHPETQAIRRSLEGLESRNSREKPER